MKTGEIIRIIVFILSGALLMLFLQPLIYDSSIIRVSNDVETWLSNNYTPGAWTVFFFSVAATLIWYFTTATAKVKGTIDTFRWQVVWWLLGLLPVIGICIAIFLNNDDKALLSVVVFFIFNGLIWLFWLPTTTSSPGLFKHIPPGSFLIRRLIG